MNEYAKAIVALLMAIIGIVEIFWGINLGINEELAMPIILILTPILVWLVPNRPAV